jgi:hypothetical protein
MEIDEVASVVVIVMRMCVALLMLVDDDRNQEQVSYSFCGQREGMLFQADHFITDVERY